MADIIELLILDPITLQPSATGIQYKKTTYSNGMSELSINTPAPTVDPLVAAKQRKLISLQASLDTQLYSSFQSSALGVVKTYNYHAKAQDNFRAEAVMLSIDPTIATVDWATKEDGFLSHTRAQFIQVVKDGAAFDKSLQMHYFTLEAQVNAATTVAALDAIVW